MEKRERRERYRRNQVMNQRHGGHGGRDSSDSSESRPPPVPKPDPKPDPKPANEKVIDHTAIPDPHMFDNLKRETDDIAALQAKKHGGKRQIISNWAKYEIPPEEPDVQQPIGRDYEMLLQSAQLGSQYHLRMERSWDPKGLPAHSAAFTIDLGVLSSALGCLPLYEKLQLPLDIFSTEELEHMEQRARCGRDDWRQSGAKGTLRQAKEGLALCGSFLQELTEQTLPGSTHPEPSKQGAPEALDFGSLPSRASYEGSVTVFKKESSVEAAPKQEELPSTAQPEPEPEPERKPEPLKDAAPGAQPPLRPASPAVDEPQPPREAQGKKKVRGGKSKANKRRSWGQEKENENENEEPSSTPGAKDSPQAMASVEQPEPVCVPKEQPEPLQEQAPVSPLEAPCEEPASVSKEKQRRGVKGRAPEPPTSPAVAREVPPMPLAVPKEKPARPPPGASSSTAPRKEDDQLDFLLSLRTPVAAPQLLDFAAPTSAVRAAIDEDEAAVAPAPPPATEKKAEDLEDWLDSMLDD